MGFRWFCIIKTQMQLLNCIILLFTTRISTLWLVAFRLKLEILHGATFRCRCYPLRFTVYPNLPLASYSLLKENTSRFFFVFFSRIKRLRRLWYKSTGGRLAHSESKPPVILDTKINQ